MRKLLVTVAMFAMAAGIFAADLPVDVSVDAGVFVKSTNFDDSDEGVEVGVRAFLIENLGVGVRLRATDLNDGLVEQGYVDGIFRIAQGKKASLSVFAGVHRDFDVEEYGLQGGLRGDLQVIGPLSGYGYIGWEKLLDRDSDHAASAGVGLSVGF